VVRILYFAWVREKVGHSEDVFDLPAGLKTGVDLAVWLAERGDGYAEAFATPKKLRCAVDQVMTHLNSPIAGATEIAFFPPVTGG
jgi:sulfur-carrier protein